MNDWLYVVIGGFSMIILKYFWDRAAWSKKYIEESEVKKLLETHLQTCTALKDMQDIKIDVAIIRGVLLEVAIKNGIDVEVYRKLTQ